MRLLVLLFLPYHLLARSCEDWERKRTDYLQAIRSWGSGPSCYSWTFQENSDTVHSVLVEDGIGTKTMTDLYNAIYDACLEGCPYNYRSAEECQASYSEGLVVSFQHNGNTIQVLDFAEC